LARPGLPLRTSLLGLVSVPLLGLVAFFVYEVHDEYEHEIEAASFVVERISERVAAHTGGFLRTSEHLLGELAKRPRVQAMDPRQCDPLIAELRQLQPAYANFLTLNTAGRLVCSATVPPAGAAAGPDPRYYFTETVRNMRFTVGKPAVGFATGRLVATMAYPVVGDSGTLAGVVGAAVDLDNFHPTVTNPRPPAGTVVAILNGDGVLIAHSDAGRQLGARLDSEAVREVLSRRSGKARLPGLGDGEQFLAFVPIAGADWIAVAGIEADQVLAPARRVAIEALTLVFVLVGVLVALTLLFKRRIEQPLEALAKIVRGVRAGDWSRRATPGGARELVEIAEELNAMIEAREPMEMALRKSEERYRLLAETSPDAILIHQDMRVVFANKALVELMRARDASELVGRSATEVVKPEFEASARERIAALYAGKPLPRTEQVYVRLDGTTVPVEIAAAPILFEGRPAGQVTVRDIADRVRERALVTGQAGIMERIAAGVPLADTLQAIIDFIEADAPEMLASILLLDEDGVHVRHAAAGRLPAAYCKAIDGQPIGPKAGSCGTAMHRGEQVIVTDIATDPLWEDYRAIAAMHNLRACWSTPIVDAERRVLGSFALYFHKPGRPNERDQQLIRMATHTAAVAIAKDHAARELATREATFRAIFENAAVGMTMTDAQGRLMHANPAFCRMLGYSAAELADRPFAEITHPDDVAENERLYRALTSGQMSQFQMRKRYVRKDGALVWTQLNVSKVPSPGGGAPFTIGMMEDITARHLAEEQRAAVEQRNRALVEALGEIAYDWRPATDELTWDGEYTRVLGYTPAEIGRDTASWVERVHPEDLPRVKAEVEQATRERRNYWLEYRFRHRDGTYRWMQDSGVTYFDERGELRRIIGVFTDISERKQVDEELRESERRYRGILETMSDGFVAMDRELRFTYVNPRAEKILGRDADSILGKAYQEVFPDATGTPFEQAYRRALAEGVTVENEHFFEPWQRWFAQRVDPTPEGISVFFRDTTERKKSESRIEYLATHDELTGLPNRNLMQDRITQALAHARRGEREVAMLHIDLDRFKVINDAYGHAFGDTVLKEAGARLAGLVREGDTVARPGGDGFLVLLADLRQSTDAYVVAQKVIDAFAQPFGLDDREVFVSASVGVSTFPQDGQTADLLIGNAEVAMYRAKELGRNTYQFFTRDMSDQTHRRVEIETALRTAVARNELYLAYQPKVDLASGRINGCEALLRWTHPVLGVVSPARFIPVAEDSGQIVPIGDWVLRTACAQARAWQAAGLPPLTVSVNLSARQFLQQDVVAWVSQVLKDTGMPAERLELELTESMIAQDAEKAIATVQHLKALGVRLAIDDFGTGYSNLSQLKRFRVDVLKIDQSFVRALDSDVDDATIVLAVISLAHNLRMSAVAEGVETEAQWRFLRLNRCDGMQGYYFSKPVPAAEMQAMLAEGRKLHNTVRP
jgi:diguanylate cyclase (GGDEF)-like protein/PAS domain S-box-containing protein